MDRVQGRTAIAREPVEATAAKLKGGSAEAWFNPQHFLQCFSEEPVSEVSTHDFGRTQPDGLLLLTAQTSINRLNRY